MVEHCFLLVMYGFCSNKALYSAILLFTLFIVPAAVVRQVIKIWFVHPFICPGIFLELDHEFFLNFGMLLEA